MADGVGLDQAIREADNKMATAKAARAVVSGRMSRDSALVPTKRAD